MRVLEGDHELASQGRKVVRSTERDHIFVYFSDHGAPGLIAFPRSELLASQLHTVLRRMHTAKKYKKMVFYVEACESGSMFENLLADNLDIFATTAANSDESSFACYWDDVRGTYLGDVYSVNWLHDSDEKPSLKEESISEQFKRVRAETNTSHVMEFGDMSIGRLPVAQFQGLSVRDDSLGEAVGRPRPMITDAVPSHDVPIITMMRRAKAAKSPSEKSRLESEYRQMIRARGFMSHMMKGLANRLSTHVQEKSGADLLREKMKLTKHSCYETLYRQFDEKCFDLSTHPFALQFLYLFVNVCESIADHESNIDVLLTTMNDHCQLQVAGHPFFRIH